MYVIAMVKNMVIRLVLGLDSRQAASSLSVTSVVELEGAELIQVILCEIDINSCCLCSKMIFTHKEEIG